jgi:hypothetical protein
LRDRRITGIEAIPLRIPFKATSAPQIITRVVIFTQ